MSFLEEFDKRAEASKTPDAPAPEIPSDLPEGDAELLDFADLIRSRQPQTPGTERARLLQRIKANQEIFDGKTPPVVIEARRKSRRYWLLAAGASVAAVLLLMALTAALSKLVSWHKEDAPVALAPNTQNSHTTLALTDTKDDFANIAFPQPVLADLDVKKAVELSAQNGAFRVTRVHGLALVQAPGETHWRVLARGAQIAPGDTVRTSVRLDSAVRLLCADGSTITLGPGSNGAVQNAAQFALNAGDATFELSTNSVPRNFIVNTPQGFISSQNASFSLRVLPTDLNNLGKNGAIVRVTRGSADLVCMRNSQAKTLAAGKAASMDLLTGIITQQAAADPQNVAWVRALENEANADHGIGQLVAKVEKANQHLPLEIVSHAVTVTCVDQVARTFVDEVFYNNTDQRLEGTFYYPLPDDAAIGEFAMFVGDKRIQGEVLEQGKARQVFEYIVRQQKDPALLEWAGGNLFKMRVFPIEPHSQKRVQLGYTQILPLRNGQVSYTYPLFSEMLLKNPLQKLSIEFRAFSTQGLGGLNSPTHDCVAALNPDGQRGTLAFSAKNYSPHCDFNATYHVTANPECVALGHLRADDPDAYFMLQLAPQASLPAPAVPERLLVIVDGSAAAGAQGYAVASEFAATCADLSTNWELGVLRGGQNPMLLQLAPKTNGLAITGPETAQQARTALAAQPPLGATDLLATFEQAAQLAQDGKGLQIIYVGTGIDTVSELSSSALVDKIAALFANTKARLSTVAVGSTYERAVMQKLAGALGGSFFRVEGAAETATAAGKVFDDFYRPRFWNARVKLSNIDSSDVYSEELGSLAAGDSAIVLGRIKHPGASASASVFFSADSTAGKIDRNYSVSFTLDAEHNPFLPKLWARAHNEALAARLGLNAPSADAQLKQELIATSVNYQIMSPFTSFLVLESDEDYARYGIKRSMKRDWTSAAPQAVSNGAHFDRAKNYWGMETLGLGEVDIFSLSNKVRLSSGRKDLGLSELDSDVLAGDLGDFKAIPLGRAGMMFDAIDDGRGRDAPFDPEQPAGPDYFEHGLQQREWGLIEKSKSLEDFVAESELVVDFEEKSLASSNKSLSGSTSLSFFKSSYDRRQSGLGFVGGLVWYDGARYSQSSVFLQGSDVQFKAAEKSFKIEQPLRTGAHYQKLAMREPENAKARLHWVLALQADSEFKQAVSALEPLRIQFPTSNELALLHAELLIKDDQADAGAAVLTQALKTLVETGAPVEKRNAFAEKIAALYNSTGQYLRAAESYAALARSAQKASEAYRLTGAAAYASQSVPDSAEQKSPASARIGTALWEETLARWPDSSDVKAGAGRWLVTVAAKKTAEHPADETQLARGIALLRAALEEDPKVAMAYIGALGDAGRVDEARTETSRLLQSANDAELVYNLLAALSISKQSSAVEESKRLLNAKPSAAQFEGVARYWCYYNVKLDQEFKRLLIAGVKDDALPPAARAAALAGLLRYNAKAGSADELAALVQRAAPDLKSVQEITDVANAAAWLQQYSKFNAMLAVSQAMLANGALNADQRALFLGYEFAAVDGLKQSAQFLAQHSAEYLGDTAKAPELETRAFVQAQISSMLKAGNALGIAGVAQDFEKRFPDSEFVPGFYASALGALAQIKKPEERDAALEKLAVTYPAQTLYAEYRARALAQKRDFHGAADVLRAALKVAARRATLIQLLARVSAQDAGQRDAFLKEAAKHEKTQSRGEREWTEGALTCLHEAAEGDKYLGALSAYFALEPRDPEWGRRLGAGLLEFNKLKEGRAVYEALSKQEPLDPQLALICQRICLAEKDDAGAKTYKERALDALTANPTKLAQFAARMQPQNPAVAMEAYERLLKIPLYAADPSTALMAANLARDAQQWQRATDLYFAALLDKRGYYVPSALNELAQMGQQEYLNATITIRASGELLKSPAQAGPLHLLLFKLKQLKHDSSAKVELDAALAAPLPEGGANYLGASIMEALAADNDFARLETYALSGGGKLSASDRRQLLRGALNRLGSDAQRPLMLRLTRKLLEEPDYNASEDRRQLIDKLVDGNDPDGALAEIRKFDEGAYGWSVSHCWDRVIDAYISKGASGRAAELALEAWAALKDDEGYGAQVLRKLATTLLTAEHDKKIDARVRAGAQAELRAEMALWFSGERNSRTDFEPHMVEALKALGLLSETDELAQSAEASGAAERIVAAARYAVGKQDYERATRVYQAALKMQPENQIVLGQLLDVQMRHTHDWKSALQTLDALKGLQNEKEILRQRVICLGQLGRLDEARVACRELMTPKFFREMNVWDYHALAQSCERNKDFALAVEVWETALRALTRGSRGRPDMGTTADFYAACGRAYKMAGNDSKALDCFLRGMSVIPRDDSHYKRVLDAALENVLVGKSLEQAVATHENKVASDGGDKPHLRIAFAEGYKRANKTREMLGQLRIAADLLPKDMRLRQEVIDGYKNIGDSAKALDAYQSWAQLDPQNIELYKGWGDLYETLGRHADALQAWASMAQVRPREAEGYRAYAQKLEALKLHGQAAAALRQALKYRPTEFEISQELAAVYRAELSPADAAEKIGALWTAGEAACRSAMADLADDPQPWLNLGRFLEAQKRTKDARELYEKIALRSWPRFQHETVVEARKRLSELKD